MAGFFTGVLALVLLGTLLPNNTNTSRFGALLQLPASLADRVLDPNVPAIGAAHAAKYGTTAPAPASSTGASSVELAPYYPSPATPPTPSSVN